MNIQFQAVNFTAQETLVDFTNKKLSKLDQYYDKIIKTKVFMKTENTTDKDNKTVEVIVEVPGDDIIVKKTGQSFEECVDITFDTLKKLIKRKKEKVAVR